MNTKKVISNKNLPVRSPIMATVVYATALSYWDAPEWLWGALGILMFIIWVGWIIGITLQENIEIFDNDKTVKSKSKFQERLEEAMAKKGEK